MLYYKIMRKRMPPERFHSKINIIAKKWAKKLMELTGSTYDIVGRENIPADEPVLFVSNHQSFFDIGIFISYIDKPKGYIAKTETLKLPLIKTWMEHLDCVFLDRSDIKKSAQAILDGIKIIKGGYSLVVFPEGTRSKTGELSEFKAGSFKLATKPKAPIVPVTINNTRRICEENHFKITPSKVTVIIHPPIKTDTLTRDEVAALPQTVKDIIQSGFKGGAK